MIIGHNLTGHIIATALDASLLGYSLCPSGSAVFARHLVSHARPPISQNSDRQGHPANWSKLG